MRRITFARVGQAVEAFHFWSNESDLNAVAATEVDFRAGAVYFSAVVALTGSDAAPQPSLL
jgi:hypothetical protein